MPGRLVGEVEGQRLPGVGHRGRRLGLDRDGGVGVVLHLQPDLDAGVGRVDPDRHPRRRRGEGHLAGEAQRAVRGESRAGPQLGRRRLDHLGHLVGPAGRIDDDGRVLRAAEAEEAVRHGGRVEGHRQVHLRQGGCAALQAHLVEQHRTAHAARHVEADAPDLRQIRRRTVCALEGRERDGDLLPAREGISERGSKLGQASAWPGRGARSRPGSCCGKVVSGPTAPPKLPPTATFSSM